jgi:hypothetical protein
MEAFLSELTDLCRKHRIGITGSPELFVMEAPEDDALEYGADADSKLVLR